MLSVVEDMTRMCVTRNDGVRTRKGEKKGERGGGGRGGGGEKKDNK